MLAFMPALALAMQAALPLDDAVGVGLILMRTAAEAPFLPPVVQAAKGDVAASVAVLVLLMATTVIYLPLVLPLLLPGTRIDPVDITTRVGSRWARSRHSENRNAMVTCIMIDRHTVRDAALGTHAESPRTRTGRCE